MSKFIDRDKELETLEKQYALDSSSFVVVYGRRRIGKTSLISRFLESHPDSLFFLATEESERQNLKEFQAKVADFIGNEFLRTANADWTEVFKAFVSFPSKTKKIIVIDEFQYIGKSNPAFPSIMQKIWDTLLKDSNVMLILCGSLVSLMKSQTLEYGSPLYGRRTAQINLKQMPFREYGKFFEGKTNNELVPFYVVTGGVPKYIESFQGFDDIYTAIEKNVLDKSSYLYEEPFFLLQKEVSEIGSYFSLIKAIALGNQKLSSISSSLGAKQTSITQYLKVLTDLDIVEREVPITEKMPEKSKKGIYRLTDNYISFWFKFVYPYRDYLEKGETDYVLSIIKERFIENHVSFVYEDVCRDLVLDMAARGDFGFRPDRVGRYWGKESGEIDIVAIDSERGNLVLGECKFSSSPKGVSVLRDLEAKKAAMMGLTNSKSATYVLFCPSGFTDELKEEANRREEVRLIDCI